MAESYPIQFGRYQLTERLAVGGMAELFLARAPGAEGFEKTLVIKRLLPHMAAHAHFNEMFIDEAKLTARLSHPKIAQTYELGRHDDQLYIAMEFIDGIDGLALLRECAHRRIRVPQELSAYIIHEALDALDFAHCQTDASGESLHIVHRDISPSNILLSRRGGVKLIDFGIARATDQSHDTKSGTLKGKYGYMSPEQVRGEELDARSDVFSIGIVLAEMLMGRRLFAAPNELDVLLMVRDCQLDRLERFGAHIDPGLIEIVRGALQKDRDARVESASGFRDLLDDWMFNNRHRVTHRELADIVNTLYDDAWSRKRESMESASAVVDGAVPEDPAPAVPVERDGIPLGNMRVTDSVPVITMESDADPLGLDAGQSGDVHVPETAPGEIGRALDLELGRVEPAPGTLPGDIGRAIDLELARIGGGSSNRHDTPQPVETVDQVQAPQAESPAHELVLDADVLDQSLVDEQPELELPSEDLDFSDLSLDIGDVQLDSSDSLELDVPASLELEVPGPDAPDPDAAAIPDPIAALTEGSVRYPSIADAVAAASLQGPDPASLDFDDSEVSARRSNPIRAARVRLPTAEEIAESPTPRPPSLDEFTEDPDEVGDLSETSPIAILYRLMKQDSTGMLVVSIGGIRKEIFMYEGVPEYVSSNVASELLGEYLVAKDAISEGELAMALAMMPSYGGRLGDTLVGLGLMTPLEVFRYLTHQVRDKLVDVCTWRKGEYRWYNGRENERKAFPLDLKPLEVLGTGAMALADSQITKWLGQTGDAKPRSEKNRHLSPDDFELGPEVRRVYDMLDGRRTIRELRARYDDDTEKGRFSRITYLLICTDLARV